MSNVSAVLRGARLRAGLAQREVARHLGISPAYLSDIEHGRRALGIRHIGKLPAELRGPVADALVKDREAEIAAIRSAR